MKTTLKILLGVMIVVVVGIGSVFYFTKDMVDASDGFFTAIKNKDLDKAYSWLSEDFKTSTSIADLKYFVEINGLGNYQQASWSSRSIEVGQGEISGSVITESGNAVPLTVKFVKGKDGWKIYSIRKPSAGLQSNTNAVRMPDEREAVSLIRESISHFALSVNQKSMQAFHDHIASIWQQQFSVDDLDHAYKAFYDANIDLTVLDELTPQFTISPELDQNGVLLITGLYPTRPSQVNFEQKYVYEGLSWKLVGFSANIK
ncbi:MAG: hypothetical protein WBM41_05740 [Arenicellales bacterium]